MPLRLTPVQWAICAIAAIGFTFDTYELLILPLVVGPALRELGHAAPGTPAYNQWVGLLFWIPALAGGIFGLLGGYLTDRFGRRRVLVWSILIYAFSTLAAGFSTSVWQFLFFRCTTFIGVCVEFVAAVAWLAELFSDPKQRESVLGYTQAFSSLGGVMVSGMAALIAKVSVSLPAIYGAHDNWRYLLISGLIPAIPLIVIRPFLPESPVWQEKRAAGTLKRPSLFELFRPEYRKATIISAAMFACSLGAAFGTIQQIPQIVPALVKVDSLLPPQARQQIIASAVGKTQFFQEIGRLVGRFLLAFLAIRILSRRNLLRVFLVPGLILIPLVFIFPGTGNLQLLQWGMFVAGLFTVAQLSFWGNYLPRVYPTHLRGTGESFAANIGGRMIGASAPLLTTQLAALSHAGAPATKLAYGAAGVAFLVYAGILILSFFLPEPKQEELPE